MSRQFRLKLDRREGFRPQDFVQSPANVEARRALDAWPRWLGGCLALVGPEGAGKSHLAALWARRADAAVIQPGADPAALPAAPILVEDADRALSGEALFHLINRAEETGGLLLTARALPMTWRTDLADLRSRLNALPVAMLQPPDDAILGAVLEKLFRERNIKPPDDLIPYLLNRMERSVAKALEIVTRLDDAADAEGKAISRTLARQILDSEPPTLNLFER